MPLEGPKHSHERRILTAQEYLDHPWVQEQTPEGTYNYELTSGDKALYFFGARHLYRADDPSFDDIRKEFETFGPDLVLIEGARVFTDDMSRARAFVENTSEEQIRARGENAYMLKLAIEAAVNVESPEPLVSDEISHLQEEGFSKNDIISYYVFRQTVQFSKEARREPYDAYLARYLAYLKKESGWSEEEFTSAEEYISGIVQATDARRYEREVNPYSPERTDARTIARASSVFRDRTILAHIEQSLATHNRIFIVYGSGHAITLEPALRELMSSEQAP